MIGRVIDESEFVLHAEEIGEYVGFPNVRLVGLYSDQDKRCYYYIDSSTKEVLEMFPIKKEDNDE